MSTKFLTFNSAVTGAFDLTECLKGEEMPKEDLPLQYTWHIWEQVQQDDRTQNYAQNTHDLASFETVQKFWQLWAFIPQPSELLDHKRMVRKDKSGKHHVVDALMIFKDNIRPMWEDPTNESGGHYEYRVSTQISPGQVDEYWNNLVLGMIGGTIEHIDIITGVRLVDKLNMNRYPCIRIEVWFKQAPKATVEALGRSLDKCLTTKLDGSKAPTLNGEIKQHSR